MHLPPDRAAPGPIRSRIPYLALAAGTIVLGLGVHLGGDALSPVARDVLGAALLERAARGRRRAASRQPGGGRPPRG